MPKVSHLILAGAISVSAHFSASAEERFEPNWESLKNYECPEWFRDAKFGIWSHWGPQSVPGFGDWYARFMYLPGVDSYTGTPAYDYHIKHYGHPTEFGYKDLIPLFTAKKWDPEVLMKLYKRAGAKYFVSMGQHHDNFDMWDSKYQPWNAVNMGPKRDIVKEWQIAAQDNGLKFGVSFHGLAAWQWFEPSRFSDLEGAKKGVSYDGWLTEEDGNGKWWAGYNPQDLYGRPHKPTQPTHVRWQKTVTEKGDAADEAYLQKFENRIRDIIVNYQPELLYFDAHKLVYDEKDNNQIIADFYNASMQWNQGENQAVVASKHLTKKEQDMWVLDYENAHSERLREKPWQTDIGYDGWFIYERPGARGMKTEALIQKLVDIVSKNGNLLLNITQNAEGEIQPYAYEFLKEMGDWMEVNSEAIHGTRPWKKFGEGPNQIDAPTTHKNQAITYSAEDFRFTTKENHLYAILMVYPKHGGQVTITSLPKGADLWFGSIEEVTLLGSEKPLEWSQTKAGLVATLPRVAPCQYAVVIKISGK